MAVKIDINKQKYTKKDFIINDINDLSKLPKYGIRGTINDPDDTVADEPCGYGSTALLCTGSATDVYLLTPDNNWTLM